MRETINNPYSDYNLDQRGSYFNGGIDMISIKIFFRGEDKREVVLEDIKNFDFEDNRFHVMVSEDKHLHYNWNAIECIETISGRMGD